MTGDITIRVRLFAMQRQLLGRSEMTLTVQAGASIHDAWESLASAHPALHPHGEWVRFARNGVYAEREEPLLDGDELALIPPVAGGGG